MQIWSGHLPPDKRSCLVFKPPGIFFFFQDLVKAQGKLVPPPDPPQFRSHRTVLQTSANPLISSFISLSLSLQLVQESTYGEMRGTRGRRLLSRLDDVRICAYMDFLKHTFQIRFSCTPPRIPRREKKKEHMIATRPPLPFTSLNPSASNCMSKTGHFTAFYLPPFITLRVATVFSPLPYCDYSRSEVHREDKRCFCHWLPQGQAYWSIWPNCANSSVMRMELLSRH